jgi:hypothetical protein
MAGWLLALYRIDWGNQQVRKEWQGAHDDRSVAGNPKMSMGQAWPGVLFQAHVKSLVSMIIAASIEELSGKSRG